MTAEMDHLRQTRAQWMDKLVAAQTRHDAAVEAWQAAVAPWRAILSDLQDRYDESDRAPATDRRLLAAIHDVHAALRRIGPEPSEPIAADIARGQILRADLRIAELISGEAIRQPVG